MDNLITMGGYGWYVWPAYGITLFVFALNIVFFFFEKKQIKKLLKQYES